MTDVKLIIFDLDGTLVDAYPAITSSFNYTMYKLGRPKEKPLVIRRAVGHGDEALLRPFITKQDLKAAVRIYRRHHKLALLNGCRLFPGVESMLSSLKKKGYLFAVASNRPTRYTWIIIRRLGLDKYFNYVLCADRLRYRKPHPAILIKIMRRFSLGPQQVAYVGDMAIDIEAGRRAFVKTVAVTTGSSTERELKQEKPHRLIRKITELLGIF